MDSAIILHEMEMSNKSQRKIFCKRHKSYINFKNYPTLFLDTQPQFLIHVIKSSSNSQPFTPNFKATANNKSTRDLAPKTGARKVSTRGEIWVVPQSL